MHHILLVDDEPILIDGLMAAFADRPDLELDIYKAYSGREALAILSRTRMDAVISDIRMPGMNGLELLSHIRRDWPQCGVIFLSGYNEFDVVYQAIQSSAVTFLLKTEGFDKIIDTLTDTLKKQDAERERAGVEEQLSAQRALTKHMLQREALSLLLTEGETPDLRCLPLRPEERVLMLYAYIQQGASDDTLEEFHTQLLATDEILRVQLSCYPLSICFWNRRSDLVWCIQPDKGQELSRCMVLVRENLEPIQDTVRRKTGMTLALAMRDTPCALSDMPGAFRALRAQVCRDMGVPGMIITGGDREKDEDSVENEHSAQLISATVTERLRNLLEHHGGDTFRAYLSSVLAPLRRTRRMRDTYAVECYMALARLLLSVINDNRLQDALCAGGELEKLTAPTAFATWDEAADYLQERSERLLFELDREWDGHTEAVMSKIMRYIDDNLCSQDALSLSCIAEKTYFSPAYLSRLFHQCTGKTISEYINAARVKRVNELLRDPRNKISDVGEAVGFSSSANFARFYKKMMGCTPKEYRDSAAITK